MERFHNKNTLCYKNIKKSRRIIHDNSRQLKRQLMTIRRGYFVWVGRMRWAHWQPKAKWLKAGDRLFFVG